MKIGLIVGTGTGPELAEVFNKFVTEVASLLNLNIQIEKLVYQPKTYSELRKFSWRDIENIENEDLEVLWNFIVNFYRYGGRAVFRTAINAEVLYQLRRKGLAIKVFPIHLRDGRRIMMIRDEMQGFYTNDEYYLSDEEIKFIGSFQKSYFNILIKYAMQMISMYLVGDFEIWALYKFHLFANLIERWFHEILDKVKLFQPDSGIDQLLKYIKNPLKYPTDILLLTSNEIGDMLCEFLMYILNIGDKNTWYSKDIFLSMDLQGLVMYQTIHGSADDIAGKNVVNPIATLRAAGDLIEYWFKTNNFFSILNEILKELEDKGIVTPDLGGTKKTMDVVDYVLEKIKLLYQR
jgi:tartrate dehydrogenase/decarboxylase/D-malate dehydrogenase